jgi:hypothetical protein
MSCVISVSTKLILSPTDRQEAHTGCIEHNSHNRRNRRNRHSLTVKRLLLCPTITVYCEYVPRIECFRTAKTRRLHEYSKET